MLFRNIYKVLVIADKISERRQIRRHGESTQRRWTAASNSTRML